LNCRVAAKRLETKTMSLQHFAVSDARLAPASLCLAEEFTSRIVDEYVQAVHALALAAAATADAEAQATLASIAIRLRAQVETYRALQAPPTDDLMDLTGHIAGICASLSRSSLAGVRLAVDAEAIWLDAYRCWRVGLIIAELIHDAVRHGSSDGPGTIWVEIADVSGRIRCLVCDDRHSPQQRQSRRSQGLVQALATELSGSIDWTFPPAGCVAHLEFPMAAACTKSVAACTTGSPDSTHASQPWPLDPLENTIGA
jgi:two-component sensor histidine kinase